MQSCALGRQGCARSEFGRANRRIFEPGSYLRRRGFFVGGRCPLRGLISFLMLLFCVGAALLAPAKLPARPPEARPLPGRRRQRGGRGGLPPAHPLPPFVPVPSSLRLVKTRPPPGRRRQRGGRGGLRSPPPHTPSLSASVLAVENGRGGGAAAWWCGRVRVRRAPPLRRFSAATQAPCAELSLSMVSWLV